MLDILNVFGQIYSPDNTILVLVVLVSASKDKYTTVTAMG